jgi:hypothetical protein
MPPHWPICVSYGTPPAPAEALTRRERWVKWRPSLFTELDPVWAAEPDLGLVHRIATRYKWACGLGPGNVSVEFFKDGTFNKLYTISSTDPDNGNRHEQILRFNMPIHPWYTVQSEVATMEFVRLQTKIPIPRVYLFDSSGENELGLEWIIMEKIDGNAYGSIVEAEMSIGAKTRLLHDVASWVHQLSTLRFDKIGSLYCRWNPTRNPIMEDFYLGPLSDFQFAYDYRQEYDIPRGPFDSIRDYLRAVTEIYQAETLDPRQHQRSQFWDLFHELESQGIMHTKRRDMSLWPSLYSKADLERIPRYCQSLRYIISLIVKEVILPPQSTFVHHFDISHNNIIVNREGDPIALVDWKQITTRPLSFGVPLPKFITDHSDLQSTKTPNDRKSDSLAETRFLRLEFLGYLQKMGSLVTPLVGESNIMGEEFGSLYDNVLTIPQSVDVDGLQFVYDVAVKRGMTWLEAPGLGGWKNRATGI